MNIEETIYQQCERLAALYQWEQVAIWCARQPEGVYEFTAILQGNQDLGTVWKCGTGSSPQEAADKVIEDAGERDPETARLKKIRELEIQLAKLRSAQATLPPYRAPNQIGYGVPRDIEPPPASETITNVESQKVYVCDESQESHSA